MSKIKIFLSDNNNLTLSEGTFIFPIKDGQIHKAVKLESNSEHGLMTSLLSILSNCDYFYIDEKTKKEYIYKESSIVKIKLNLKDAVSFK